MKARLLGIAALALAAGAIHGIATAQATAPIRIGGNCDLTGSTKVIGLEICPGVADYIALVNRKGGVLGHKLEYTSIDHAYMVPRAVEDYEQSEAAGRRDGVQLRRADPLRPHVAVHGGPDPGVQHRHRPQRCDRRRDLALHLSRHLVVLVAGRRGAQVPQGQRREEGHEDRLPVLRQSGGPRGPADGRGDRAEGRLRAAHVRGAAPRARDGAAGERDRPRLQGGLGSGEPVRRGGAQGDPGAASAPAIR